MKLFLIHCGFYHEVAGGGIYELHDNLFVAARSFDDALRKAKALPEFRARRMHIDGMQEIAQVQGYRVALERAPAAAGGQRDRSTVVRNKRSFFA